MARTKKQTRTIGHASRKGCIARIARSDERQDRREMRRAS